MALSFDKIISGSENVSLEDLSIECLVQTDLDPGIITFNDLFQDHLSVLNAERNNDRDELTDHGIFDVDVYCGDIDKSWISECDIIDSFPFDDLRLTDFELNRPIISSDNEENLANDTSFVSDSTVNECSDTSKKNATTTRRQSTRIENQTRKKIAEQIQRENIRLALEAQLLNGKHPVKQNNNSEIPDEKYYSPAMQRYLALPTDLDAEDDESEDEIDITSDDDPNKLWCICRQPYGDRFMICCDNCMEWYHGDCVGVTQKEGADMEEFTCPMCVINSPANDTPKKQEEIVVIDDDEDNENELLCIDDEDCLITKAVQPMKFTSNIFQLINKVQSVEADKPSYEAYKKHVPSLSKRTSVCLNQICKTLVDPKKSLYCSRSCIDKYTKMVIKNNLREKAKQYGLPKGPKLAKMTRFVLAQPATDTIQDECSAPTEDNLKEFLLKNPTYKVYQSAKTVKTKQSREKSKKFLELINKDPSRHIKIVKHFAMIFKKSMPLKIFNAEFRNIWQLCVKIEEGVLEMCDKVINDKYMLKVKQLSEYLRKEEDSRPCMDLMHEKLSISDLLSLSKEQLDARSKIIVLDDPAPTCTDRLPVVKKTFPTVIGGISLLSDTTHLHTRHLYDINCKICNGASKSKRETKKKGIEPLPSSESVVPVCPEVSTQTKVPSPPSTDESRVTSSVKTPDLLVDMDICSTPSEKDDNESNINNDTVIDSKVPDSSSLDVPIENNVSIKQQKRKLVCLWEGDLTYKEVGSVTCKSYLVTRYLLNKQPDQDQNTLTENGDDDSNELDVSSSIDSQIFISGRSELNQVLQYFRRLRKHSNKEFIVLRLHPTNLEIGRQTYLEMFEYLHSRERCGVMKPKKPGVKDCFIYPLNAHAPIPSIFKPFIGPGLEKRRPHLLLLLLVRNPLTQIEYQPISPKYDQEHEFAKKHGINFDKYFKPNPNPPFCPSPIASPSDHHTSTLNHRSRTDREDKNSDILSTVDSCEVVRSKNVVEEEHCKVTCDTENTDDKLAVEHVNNICDHDRLKEIKSSKDEYQEEAVKDRTETSVLEAAVVVARHIPSPQKVTDDTIGTPTVSTCKTLLPDTSLLPRAFVYRRKVCTATPPVQPDPVPLVATEVVKDLESVIKQILNPAPDVVAATDPLFGGQDLDFRCAGSETPLSVDAGEIVDCAALNSFLRRKTSSRLYTYYDSFDGQDTSPAKRRRYFFNPRCPESGAAPGSVNAMPVDGGLQRRLTSTHNSHDSDQRT